MPPKRGLPQPSLEEEAQPREGRVRKISSRLAESLKQEKEFKQEREYIVQRQVARQEAPAEYVPPAPPANSANFHVGPRVSTETAKRIQRALSQRMFLVDRLDAGNPSSRRYLMLGSTGNVYTIRISRSPSCDCPDFSRGNQPCKHIIFILCRVLGLSPQSHLIDSRVLSSDELEQIFANDDARGGAAAAAVQAAQAVVEAVTGKKVAAAEPVEEEEAKEGERPVARKAEGECCVCFEDFASAGAAQLKACSVCQNHLHGECITAWLSQSRDRLCPYCRSPWAEFGKKKPPAAAAAAAAPHARNYQNGYRNFAAEAGIGGGGGGGRRANYYDADY